MFLISSFLISVMTKIIPRGSDILITYDFIKQYEINDDLIEFNLAPKSEIPLIVIYKQVISKFFVLPSERIEGVSYNNAEVTADDYENVLMEVSDGIFYKKFSDDFELKRSRKLSSVTFKKGLTYLFQPKWGNFTCKIKNGAFSISGLTRRGCRRTRVIVKELETHRTFEISQRDFNKNKNVFTNIALVPNNIEEKIIESENNCKEGFEWVLKCKLKEKLNKTETSLLGNVYSRFINIFSW